MESSNRVLAPMLLAPMRRPLSGSNTPPLGWRYYAAHQVAPLRRPQNGSIVPPGDIHEHSFKTFNANRNIKILIYMGT